MLPASLVTFTGLVVGDAVSWEVGAGVCPTTPTSVAVVGSGVGSLDGDEVGASVGTSVDVFVGSDVGSLDGDEVGAFVGTSVDTFVGDDVGAFDGAAVGLYVGEQGSSSGNSTEPSKLYSKQGLTTITRSVMSVSSPIFASSSARSVLALESV